MRKGNCTRPVLTIEQQVTFLRAHSTAVMGHTQGSLLDHLKGVHDLLVQWGGSKPLATAGLFHSVYGTESYKTEAVPSRRSGSGLMSHANEDAGIVYLST